MTRKKWNTMSNEEKEYYWERHYMWMRSIGTIIGTTIGITIANLIMR